ncbi:nuclease-related domain-containing protein [Sporolactobacillus nakayamae]|uniref:nuclease-related domain-containing protein n=1 Tax=Sporolactobacillus nakayamae TaxID=269670 RepID=UPI0015A69E5E|nr:nuclease-related domain-containing protein [Sporolactobacillus nakayamae]
MVESDAAKLYAGWKGEQNLAYYLKCISDPTIRIFYDLHLKECQIDVLLLTPTFLSILEVKNYSGVLSFYNDLGQVVRTMGGRREGFANPILQANRHRMYVQQWLTERHFPDILIETDVVIAHPSTIVDSSDKTVKEHVFHAEKAPIKLQRMINNYQGSPNYSRFLPQIEKALLNDHHDPFPDVLQKFGVSSTDLQRGVLCEACHHFSMQRISANWQCARCGHRSKNAHRSMILHYFLLFGPTMTNKQCRDFLKIDNAKLMIDLLNKMNLKREGIGPGRGQYYCSPSYETFDQLLSPEINNRIWKAKD